MAERPYDEGLVRPSRRFWIGVWLALAVIGINTLTARWVLFPRSSAPDVIGSAFEVTAEPIAEELALSETERASLTPAVSAPPLTSTEDQVSGVRLALPEGWSLTTSAPLLLAQPNVCQGTGVIVYPFALQDRALTAALLTQHVLNQFKQTISEDDSVLADLEWGQLTGESPVESLLSTEQCGKAVEGIVRTTLAGRQGLVRIGWYPVDDPPAKQLIDSILQSYAATSSGRVLVIGGDQLELAAPSDWTALHESQRSRVTSPSGDQMVQVAVLDRTADDPLVTTLDTWLNLELTGDGLSLTVQAEPVESTRDEAGRSWTIVGRRIELERSGRAQTALIEALSSAELGTTVLLRWREAPSESWPAAQAQLLAIANTAAVPAGSALVTNVSLPIVWPSASPDGVGPYQRDEFTARLAAAATTQWQSVILGFDRVEAPDGTQLWAPRSQLHTGTGTYFWPEQSNQPLAPVVESE